MNKQELIEKINNLQYSLSWNIPRINKETVLDLIEQLDEPKKVVVPQFVADWINEARKTCKDVAELFEFDFTNDEVGKWFMQERPFDLVARAWLDGYEVEKEKRYRVKMKGLSEHYSYLNYDSIDNEWYFTDSENGPAVGTNRTRKELEEAGFGWVFDCPGMEIEEVE